MSDKPPEVKEEAEGAAEPTHGVLKNKGKTVADEEKPRLIPASQVKQTFPTVITNEGTLDKNIVDIIRKCTKFPASEAENLVLSNPLVKKHLKPNMTIIEIIKVLKRAEKGLLKDPVAGYGSLLAGLGTSRNVMTDDEELLLSNMLSELDVNVMFCLTEWNFRVKRFNVDSHGIASCVKLNEGSLTNQNDVVFAGVLVHLIHAGILLVESEGILLVESEHATNDATDEEATFVSEAMIECAEKLTKVVLKVALQARCQNSERKKLTCYESYSNVCGGLLSKSRLVAICEAIFDCGTMNKVMGMFTIREIDESQNNDGFTPRLKWLSTPELVKKALTIMPLPLVARFFDPYALLAYRQFEEAGLPSQIASGPLSSLCRGNINPLVVTHISPDLVLSELAPIENPPYDEPTIRRAKIILDVVGFNYGRWYQGKRASRAMDRADYIFKAVVEKVFDVFTIDGMTKIGKIDALSRDEVAALMGNESAKKEDQVVAVLRGWV